MEFSDTPDHETGSNRDDAGRGPEREDGDRINEAFAALSDDPLEWAERQAEMHGWADESGASDGPV